MGEAAVIWGRLTEAFWLNCQLFGLTLLFALPLGLVRVCSGVSFMDSSGIAVVMRARQRMRELGGSIALRNAGPQPRKVLEAAGLDRFETLE